MTRNIFYDDFSKEVWQTTFKDYKDDTLDDTFKRVAKAVAVAENDKEYWEGKFYDLFSDFKFTVGGRVYSNAGTEWTGTTWHNCFVGPKPSYDQDSIEGILQVLFSQVKTLKAEGGWGMNFSFIRPRGSFIKGIGVESPGSVKYMELFDKSSEIITAGSGSKSKHKKSKGKIRKGAMMAMLFVWHPDIEEFITAKLQEGRLTKFNISAACTNEFMDKVVAIDDLKKQGLEVPEELDKWDLVFPDTSHERYKEEWNGNIDKWKEKGYPVVVHKTVKVSDLWNKIMTSTYMRNDPGIFFPDRANYTHCWNYGKGSEIQATNPSLRKGTKILTDKGIFSIDKLEDKNIKVYNLKGDYSNAICKLSGKEKPLYKITLNTNFEYFCTAEHRWATQNGEKTTLDLKVGDKLPILKKKKISNGCLGDRDDGFLIGWLLGDGWITVREDNGKKQYGFIFSKEDYESGIADKVVKILQNKCNYTGGLQKRQKNNSKEWYEINTQNNVFEKYFSKFGNPCKNTGIPEIIFEEGSEELIKGIIDGYTSSDGHVSKNIKQREIVYVSKNKKLLSDISELLGFYGIRSFLKSYIKDKSSFPNGKQYNRTYNRNDLVIRDIESIIWFKDIFTLSHPRKQSNLDKTSFKKISCGINYNIVKSVELTKIKEDVWDITVYDSDNYFSLSHCITHNCGEQSLPFGANCDLGSMNLVKYFCLKTRKFLFNNFRNDVKNAVRVLDNINEVSPSPLPEYTDSMRHRRRIGLGVMGWASLLYLMKVRFASDEAYKIQQEIMKIFTHSAVEASIELAEEKGMFRDCEPEKHANHPYWRSINLPENLVEKIRKSGIRNSSLFSIQPTGNTGVFANIVSGGLEPIFGQEWIRTVIVNSPPDELLDLVPKYWEGDFKPNKYFKVSKEGTDDILRYVHSDGTVYKIDRNRGLTKEVLCQDYSVRVLKELGEWNPKADWAITAFDLNVEEHVKDMEGFAKWIDSSISKTINVKNDYPFEDFKEIYLNAYKGQKLKGITTYREGTMANVLALKTEVKKFCNDAPKREKILNCDIYSVKVKGEKFFVIIGLMGGPYEVFAGKQDFELDRLSSSGTIEKVKRGQYRLLIDDEIICENVCDHLNNEEEAVTRLISTSLRHNVDLNFLVHQLEKSKGELNSLSKAISRCLKKYIEDGTEINGEECPECGGKLQRKEGCASCVCGYSKCS